MKYLQYKKALKLYRSISKENSQRFWLGTTDDFKNLVFKLAKRKKQRALK